MPDPIYIDLTAELSNEHKNLLVALVQQELNEPIVKLDRKHTFILDEQEITLSHSIQRHVDIATSQVIYAVYAPTYNSLLDQQLTGKKELSDAVVGKGSNAVVKKIIQVFVIEDKQLKLKDEKKLVAKVIAEPKPEDADQIANWAQEGSLVAQFYQDVTHTNIRVNTIGKRKASYLMPFFPGVSGERAIKNISQQEDQRKQEKHTASINNQIVKFVSSLNSAISLAEAVQRFHEDGFFHGDIKPENIVVSEDNHLVLLTDVASPKELGSEVANNPLWATLSYFPPEHLNDEVETYEKEADIYSMWVTLVEIMAGARRQVNEKVCGELPFVKFPGDEDAAVEAEQFILMKQRGLHEDPLERPTTEEAIKFLAAMRDRYLSKLSSEEDANKLMVDRQTVEATLTQYENPKRWQDKLAELENNIKLAIRFIETAKNHLICKTFPGYKPENNIPIDVKQLNPKDQLKFDCFNDMEAQLTRERTQIEHLVRDKPAEKTYRTLYKEKYKAVLDIVNKPDNVKALGKHQNIILGILNGVYKLLSRIFGGDQDHKMLGADSTMTKSAKNLLAVKQTLQNSGMRK